MNYIEPKNINEIISYIEYIIDQVERGRVSITTGASSIVGATLANSSLDIRTLYSSYPNLEELVELSADNEIYDEAKLSSSPKLRRWSDDDWETIKTLFKAVRQQVADSRP